jgi:tRNA 2-thiouridine synthesizing protein A
MTEIDATGLKCPMPVLRLQKALRALDSGARVTLLATDGMAAIDVPHFCAEQGHALLSQEVKQNTAANPRIAGGETLLIFEIEKA